MKNNSFFKILLLLNLIFLLLLGVALRLIGDYLSVFESGQFENCFSEIRDSITPEVIFDAAADTIQSIENKSQTREECRSAFLKTACGPFNFKRLAEESSSNVITYAVLWDNILLGKLCFEEDAKLRYNIRGWQLVSKEFDLNALNVDSSITVPESFSVKVGEYVLDESNVIDKNIAIPLYAEINEKFNLEKLITYSFSSFIDGPNFRVFNPEGKEIADIEIENLCGIIADNCSELEKEYLRSFSERFITRYVDFGSSAENPAGRCEDLCNLLVPNSPLIGKFYSLVDVYKQYGQNLWDVLKEIEYNGFSKLDENHWICDVTFSVDSMGKTGGSGTTVNRMRLLVTELYGRLYVEEMYQY